MMMHYNETQSGLPSLEKETVPTLLVQDIIAMQAQILDVLQQDMHLFKEDH